MRRLLGRTWGATLAVSGSDTRVQCGEPIPFNAITEDNGGWIDPNTPSAFVVPSGVTWVEIDSGLDNGDAFINVVEMYVNNSLVGYDVGSEIYRPGMFIRQEPIGNDVEFFGPMPVAAGDLIDFRMTFKSTGNTLTFITSAFVRIRPVGWE